MVGNKKEFARKESRKRMCTREEKKGIWWLGKQRLSEKKKPGCRCCCIKGDRWGCQALEGIRFDLHILDKAFKDKNRGMEVVAADELLKSITSHEANKGSSIDAHINIAWIKKMFFLVRSDLL